MHRYRQRLPLILFLCTVIGFSTGLASQPAAPQGIKTAAIDQTAQGIALYQQGKNEEAIKVLKDSAKRYDDLRAWHYLGLAFEKTGKAKDARKAHEKAAKLGTNLLDSQLGSATDFQDTVKKLAVIRAELALGGISAQKYLDLNPDLSDAKRDEWSARADELSSFGELGNDNPATQTFFPLSQVDVKPQFLSRPEPPYTEEARRHKVSGTVILRALFLANGRVVAYPIKTLPSGLTEQSMRAARLIKFVPAMKDGRPVSVRAEVEYHFNVY
jgi:tetratricopeptide (TPR) repeat protein